MVKKMKPKRNKYTVGGLFSGVGGIEQGFENNGFSISWPMSLTQVPVEHTD